jgi:hypothetical protein
MWVRCEVNAWASVCPGYTLKLHQLNIDTEGAKLPSMLTFLTIIVLLFVLMALKPLGQPR